MRGAVEPCAKREVGHQVDAAILLGGKVTIHALTKQPNSEGPFMIVMYMALLVFARTVTSRRGWSGYFIAGLLVGGAMLIRPRM